jgi:hypothetical protein
MKSLKAVSALAVLALAVPASARAQCAGGAAMVPALGIELVECDCTVGSPNAAAWRFRTPPKVVSIAEGSAADGVLQPGDVILQVGGIAITTPEGAAAFARARTIAATPVLIQRDGRTQQVTLRSAELCPTTARIMAVAPTVTVAGRGGATAPARAGSAESPRGAQAITVQGVLAPSVRSAQGALTPSVTGAPGVISQAPPGMFTWIGIAFSCDDCTVDRADGRWIFRSPPEVYSVESGSPAHVAGLRRGDVLTHVDGTAITSEGGGRRWAQVKPGQTVRVSYRRGNAQRVASIRAGDPKPLTVAGTYTMYPTVYRTVADTNALAIVREYAATVEQAQAGEELTLRRLMEQQARNDTTAKRHFDQVLRRYMEQQEVRSRERDARTQEVLRVLEASVKEPPRVARGTLVEQRLRFSGSIGTTDVEVRGLNSVVVTEQQDELIITTSDATIRIRVPRRD